MTESIKGIIAQLEHLKAAIDRALVALREIDGGDVAATTAAKKTPAKKNAAAAAPIVKKSASRKGTISPEGRQKLADAMKKRWAIKRAGSAAKTGARKSTAKKKAQ
jgi:hypothetical protein